MRKTPPPNPRQRGKTFCNLPLLWGKRPVSFLLWREYVLQISSYVWEIFYGYPPLEGAGGGNYEICNINHHAEAWC